MKNYNYIARDGTGAQKQGFLQAISSNDVLNWLREQGFTPISINEITTAAKKVKVKSQRKRIKSAELAALCWQLTTMVEGGIPITEALEAVSEDIENSHLQDVLKKVLEKVLKGQPFSESLGEFPKVFDNLCCAIILSGEAGGNLAQALYRVAEYFDTRDKLKKKVKAATAYPTFVLSFIVLIVIFIMAFIVPRFTAIFDQIGGELPAFTRAFMGFYDLMRFQLHYIIGSVILLIILGIWCSKTKRGHYLFSRFVLRIPLLGSIFSQAFVAMFSKTMSMLVVSGVSVLEIFDILSEMTRNDIIKDAIKQSREHIVEGESISASMATTGFFPNMLIKMVQVGEQSGSISKVLERTSDYYERKVDTTITTVMSLLEPIMIVTVGLIVLVVVLALYLPIFTMSDIKG